MSVEIDFREASPKDVDFIKSSYLRSFRVCGDNTRMTNDVYYYNYGKVIERLMSRCKCLIACDVEDGFHIYGYVLYEMIDDVPVVHYVYVKYTFRHLGIAKSLVKEAIGETCTTIAKSHVARIYDHLKKKHDIHYNPFLRFYENK